MDQINRETRRQDALDLKCKQTPVRTSEIVLNPGTEITLLTPQRTTDPLQAKIKEQNVDLPDKWVSLKMYMSCFF